MTEQYLLDELSPEAREEFEEHYFDCHECGGRCGRRAAFVEQSKIVLGEKAAVLVRDSLLRRRHGKSGSVRRSFYGVNLLRLVVTYQNFVSVPKLLEAANHPHELAWTT